MPARIQQQPSAQIMGCLRNATHGSLCDWMASVVPPHMAHCIRSPNPVSKRYIHWLMVFRSKHIRRSQHWFHLFSLSALTAHGVWVQKPRVMHVSGVRQGFNGSAAGSRLMSGLHRGVSRRSMKGRVKTGSRRTRRIRTSQWTSRGDSWRLAVERTECNVVCRRVGCDSTLVTLLWSVDLVSCPLSSLWRYSAVCSRLRMHASWLMTGSLQQPSDVVCVAAWRWQWQRQLRRRRRWRRRVAGIACPLDWGRSIRCELMLQDGTRAGARGRRLMRVVTGFRREMLDSRWAEWCIGRRQTRKHGDRPRLENWMHRRRVESLCMGPFVLLDQSDIYLHASAVDRHRRTSSIEGVGSVFRRR